MFARLRIVLVLITGSVLLASVVGIAASARVPKAPRVFGTVIEPDTAYVPQTSCDPAPGRWGTEHLGELLTATYVGSTFYTSRPCDGSVSEHSDGRAIDWMVSARVPAQKAQGDAFLAWLLATDAHGNTFAMARRLGVMYVIFNSRMWGAWDGRWHEYNGCQHGALRAVAHDNDCHRTHVHISLSWNGARGKTTFWTGHTYRTDYGPCVAPGKKLAPKWSAPNRRGCDQQR